MFLAGNTYFGQISSKKVKFGLKLWLIFDAYNQWQNISAIYWGKVSNKSSKKYSPGSS